MSYPWLAGLVSFTVTATLLWSPRIAKVINSRTDFFTQTFRKVRDALAFSFAFVCWALMQCVPLRRGAVRRWPGYVNYRPPEEER